MEIQWGYPTGLGPEEREAAEARIRRLAEAQPDVSRVEVRPARNRHHRDGFEHLIVRADAGGRELETSGRGATPAEALGAALRHLARALRERRRRQAGRARAAVA